MALDDDNQAKRAWDDTQDNAQEMSDDIKNRGDNARSHFEENIDYDDEDDSL